MSCSSLMKTFTCDLPTEVPIWKSDAPSRVCWMAATHYAADALGASSDYKEDTGH